MARFDSATAHQTKALISIRLREKQIIYVRCANQELQRFQEKSKWSLLKVLLPGIDFSHEIFFFASTKVLNCSHGQALSFKHVRVCVVFCVVACCLPTIYSGRLTCGRTNRGHTSSSSSSSTPLYCLRENISFDTLIRRSSRGHNSRKATQPSHCGTCLILLIFIAKRVQPSLPSSTLRSNFVYPRQISRSPRVGHCMS